MNRTSNPDDPACCQAQRHPEPTPDQRREMENALTAAMDAVDKAWGYANRTPAYHYLTDVLGPMAVELLRQHRIA